MPEYTEAGSWDKVRVEIDFNSSLTHFEYLNERDLAKVAAIFTLLYSVMMVEGAVNLSLELLAVFTFIRD